MSVPDGPYRALRQLPAEVWLDDDGLIHRVAVTQTPAAPAGRHTWVVAELWDFGVAADITVPPPGEVVTPREAGREAGQPDH